MLLNDGYRNRAAFGILACWVLNLFMLFIGNRGICGNLPPVRTVFLIVMENKNWSGIKGNAAAPYINNTLLPMSSYCNEYYATGLHPSLPNYLWLEGGTNFGVTSNNDPSVYHQNTTNHLVTLLNNAGVSWKSYQEDISAGYVPLFATNGYVPRHNPMVYFDDVTGTNNANFPYGTNHIRPYSELAGDLTNNTVARYNFITPNLCNDMHDSCSPLNNPIGQGDDWLSNEIPKILNSAAYKSNGVIFIIWDEGDISDGPIGMIMVSPLGKGKGYTNKIHYTHSSMLRTVQEIFGVTPFLGDAANAANLSDLFAQLRVSDLAVGPGSVQFTVTGVLAGKTNLVQRSSDLASWSNLSTNTISTNRFVFTDFSATNTQGLFYRVVQLP